jgi:hypothetical protein
VVNKSTTHNFLYSKEDIENLIKGDIAARLGMDTIPIISHSINFILDTEDATFSGVVANVEVPG